MIRNWEGEKGRKAIIGIYYMKKNIFNKRKNGCELCAYVHPRPCISVCVCLCVYLSASGPWRSEELDPLELKLKVIVSYLVWVLGTKLESSTRTVEY